MPKRNAKLEPGQTKISQFFPSSSKKAKTDVVPDSSPASRRASNRSSSPDVSARRRLDFSTGGDRVTQQSILNGLREGQSGRKLASSRDVSSDVAKASGPPLMEETKHDHPPGWAHVISPATNNRAASAAATVRETPTNKRGVFHTDTTTDARAEPWTDLKQPPSGNMNNIKAVTPTPATQRKSAPPSSPIAKRNLFSNPRPSSRFTQEVARRANDRERARDCVSASEIGLNEAKGSSTVVQLSEEQKRIAEHPPHIPLAVRAGAGTGKTQTMVTRAVKLVTLYGLDPAKILMVTFTKKASGEMRERVACEFRALHAQQQQHQQREAAFRQRLPTVKTFHSLAYSWIRDFWKQSGLGRYPSLMVTKTQEKSFMKEVIHSHVEDEQLWRCYKFLGLPLASGDQTSPSWDTVLRIVKDEFPDKYARARARAEAELSSKTQASPKAGGSKPDAACQPKTPPEKKLSAAQKRKADEREWLLQSEIQRQCCHELLGCDGNHEESPAVECPTCIERKWKEKDVESTYLKLVARARLGQHRLSDYLPDDAALLRRYERMQERTGKIDFDKLLERFDYLLRNDAWISSRFRDAYDYVIVDEFQDNSKVQSELLRQIVKEGRVTVVGDDDQCIYAFRGAWPGNFDSFARHYSSLVGQVTHARLEENYRSTGNILQVGGACLQGLTKPTLKMLRPTRGEGSTVELWKCKTTTEQAREIASKIKERHDGTDNSKWGDVACLFRCFRMGPQAPLHFALQQQLGEMKIPFKVVGGQSLLAGEHSRDVLAYLALTLTGTRERTDDFAFSRVLNKPSRQIGKKAMDAIKAHQAVMTAKETASDSSATPVGLEEAAKALLLVPERDLKLSKSQVKGLEEFFNLVGELRVAALDRRLPSMLEFIWERTGLAELHNTKETKKTEKNNVSGAVSRDQADGAARTGIKETLCVQIKALVAVAEAHLKEWGKREDKRSRGVRSLASLASECPMKNACEMKHDELPQLDELRMPGGVGLPIVSSFLEDLALQMSDTEGDQASREEDKVTLCTIHRAKGLEWNDVYVPFFNEGYMPTRFREDETDDIPGRHQRECHAREGRHCNMECAGHYNRMDEIERGISARALHNDEEKRLAHVAATRARNRLVLVSTNADNIGKPCETSSFLRNLPVAAMDITNSRPREDSDQFECVSVLAEEPYHAAGGPRHADENPWR